VTAMTSASRAVVAKWPVTPPADDRTFGRAASAEEAALHQFLVEASQHALLLRGIVDL
jgi:hypothetical protein